MAELELNVYFIYRIILNTLLIIYLDNFSFSYQNIRFGSNSICIDSHFEQLFLLHYILSFIFVHPHEWLSRSIRYFDSFCPYGVFHILFTCTVRSKTRHVICCRTAPSTICTIPQNIIICFKAQPLWRQPLVSARFQYPLFALQFIDGRALNLTKSRLVKR